MANFFFFFIFSMPILVGRRRRRGQIQVERQLFWWRRRGRSVCRCLQLVQQPGRLSKRANDQEGQRQGRGRPLCFFFSPNAAHPAPGPRRTTGSQHPPQYQPQQQQLTRNCHHSLLSFLNTRFYGTPTYLHLSLYLSLLRTTTTVSRLLTGCVNTLHTLQQLSFYVRMCPLDRIPAHRAATGVASPPPSSEFRRRFGKPQLAAAPSPAQRLPSGVGSGRVGQSTRRYKGDGLPALSRTPIFLSKEVARAGVYVGASTSSSLTPSCALVNP